MFLVILDLASGNNCADFNELRSRSSLNGMEGAFQCPDDGISNSDYCTGKIHVRNTNDNIDRYLIDWNDIVIIFLVQSRQVQMHSLIWWIKRFPAHKTLNLVIIADYCPHPCVDHVASFGDHLMASFNHTIKLNLQVVRGLQDIDHGVFRVACKTLTGFRKAYNLFPTKKYFFKINEDTVIFPDRFLNFVSSLNAATNAESEPLYFGSILHMNRGVPLCDEMGVVSLESREPTYPRKNGHLDGIPICHAQGDAGYGMNRLAMEFFSNVTLCTLNMDLESVQEDTYFGWKLFRDLNVVPIHCGAFRPSGLSDTVSKKDTVNMRMSSLVTTGEFFKKLG